MHIMNLFKLRISQRLPDENEYIFGFKTESINITSRAVKGVLAKDWL